MSTRKLGFAALLLASVCIPALAAAQTEAGNSVETVVVTAEKRAENIQNVPLSIVAFSGEALANSGVTNISGLQKIVPDLQITSHSQAAAVTLRIRGFGAESNAAIDPDVAPYIDGVYIPRPGAMLTTFLDVKSVEVLRGPQGTLFGRNATMGVIALTTNSPSTDKSTLDMTVGGGSYGRLSATAIANLPLSDSFAVRFAAATSHGSGYITNRLDGKTYGEHDNIAGRLSAKWDITPDVNWTLRADYALTNGDGVKLTAVDVATATPAQLANFTTRLGGNVPPLRNPPSFTTNQYFAHPHLHDSQYGIDSDLRWHLGKKYSLRLIDSYRNWSNTQHDGDVLFTPLNVLSRHGMYASKSQSHELQLISPKGAFLGSKLGFTAGLYYFNESYSIGEVLDLGSQYCSFVIAAYVPALVPACNAGPKLGATNSRFVQNAESLAGYFQLNYEVLPNLEFDIGARESHDSKKGRFVQTITNPTAVLLRRPETTPLEFSDSQPTWRANLAWHVTKEVMLFATYSTGYKSGGFNSSNGRVIPSTRVFASETDDDYELGMKSIWWNRKLLLNATLFQTNLKNFQDRSFNGLSFLVRNAGDVRARGMEIEGQVHAVDHLGVNFGVDYLDSIYTRNTHAPGLPACTGRAGSCPTVQNLSGRVVSYSPKWKGNVEVEADSNPFAGGYTAILSVGAHFTSSFQTQPDDNPQGIVSGHAVLNARLSVYNPDGKWELDFYAQNLTDNRYVTAKFPQTLDSLFGVRVPATGATLYRDYVGAPRILGVRLSARF